MAARKGHEKIGGRQKGTPNRFTAELKSMIEQALTNAGGVDYLTQQAKENPNAFMGLLGKIIPRDISARVTGADGGPLQVQHLSDDDLRQQIITLAARVDDAGA